MEGVGGVKGEGGLESLGESAGSGVRDKDREEQGPVLVVELEGVAGCVEGVKDKETGGGVGEVGEDVDPNTVFSKSGLRPSKFRFYFENPVFVKSASGCGVRGVEETYTVGEVCFVVSRAQNWPSTISIWRVGEDGYT